MTRSAGSSLLLVLSGLGGIAFVAVAGALRSPELTQLRNAVRRRRSA